MCVWVCYSYCLYPLIHWWILRMFSCFSSCDNVTRNLGTPISLWDPAFTFGKKNIYIYKFLDHMRIQFSSVQSLSHVWLFVIPGLHARPPCPSPTPGIYPNSCPLSRWCHPTISCSIVSFASCLQSFPKSGPFQMSQLFISGGQNIGVSASTSVLPMKIQDWSPLGWTGWISLQFKGLSRIFSNTTVQKHQLFCAQLSL